MNLVNTLVGFYSRFGRYLLNSKDLAKNSNTLRGENERENEYGLTNNKYGLTNNKYGLANNEYGLKNNKYGLTNTVNKKGIGGDENIRVDRNGYKIEEKHPESKNLKAYNSNPRSEDSGSYPYTKRRLNRYDRNITDAGLDRPKDYIHTERNNKNAQPQKVRNLLDKEHKYVEESPHLDNDYGDVPISKLNSEDAGRVEQKSDRGFGEVSYVTPTANIGNPQNKESSHPSDKNHFRDNYASNNNNPQVSANIKSNSHTKQEKGDPDNVPEITSEHNKPTENNIKPAKSEQSEYKKDFQIPPHIYNSLLGTSPDETNIPKIKNLQKEILYESFVSINSIVFLYEIGILSESKILDFVKQTVLEAKGLLIRNIKYIEYFTNYSTKIEVEDEVVKELLEKRNSLFENDKSQIALNLTKNNLNEILNRINKAFDLDLHNRSEKAEIEDKFRGEKKEIRRVPISNKKLSVKRSSFLKESEAYSGSDRIVGDNGHDEHGFKRNKEANREIEISDENSNKASGIHNKDKYQTENSRNKRSMDKITILRNDGNDSEYLEMIMDLIRSIYGDEGLQTTILKYKWEFYREKIPISDKEAFENKISLNLGGYVFSPSLLFNLIRNIDLENKKDTIKKSVIKFTEPLSLLHKNIINRSFLEKKRQILEFLISCYEIRNNVYRNSLDQAFYGRSNIIEYYANERDVVYEMLDKLQEEDLVRMIIAFYNMSSEHYKSVVVVVGKEINDLYMNFLCDGQKGSKQKIYDFFSKHIL